MSMDAGLHARLKYRFHVHCRVSGISGNRQRPNFGNALTTGRAPTSFRNREQPDFAKRLNHCSAWPFRRLGFGELLISVDVPVDRPLPELAKLLAHEDKAAHLTPGSLAYGNASASSTFGLAERWRCSDYRRQKRRQGKMAKV